MGTPIEPHSEGPSVQPQENEKPGIQIRPASAVTSESQHLTAAEVGEKPWKYIGYKGYSDFIASDTDFFILRRFASLSIRIALSLQDQVAVLEESLEELDRKYSRKAHPDVNNGSFREDEVDRAAVLEKLRQKLVQYSTYPVSGCINLRS